MRNIFLSVIVVVCHFVNAQNFLLIDSVQEVSVADVNNNFYPVLSDDGHYVAIRSYSKHGLLLYDLETGKLDTLVEESKFIKHVVFDPLGDKLYYTEPSGSGQVLVKTYEIANQTEIAQKKSGNNFWGWFMQLWSPDDELQTSVMPDLVLIKNNRVDYPCTSVQDDSIVIHFDRNEKKKIKPLNVNYFLHASLSPNQKRLVGYAYGKGSFVCNVDGTGVKMIDHLEAPVWLSDDIVLGMITRDDGHEVKSSAIAACQLSSNKYQTLLPFEQLGLYPQYNKYCSKIYCHTANGKLFMLHLAR